MYFLLPFIASAQSTTTPTVKDLVFKISYNILNPLIQVGFAVALVWFLWGVVQYIRDRNSGHVWDANAVGGKEKEGNPADNIVYGLFGLFIMVSAFAIMRILRDFLGSSITVY